MSWKSAASAPRQRLEKMEPSPGGTAESAREFKIKPFGARYPPLQTTQGRGTRRFSATSEAREDGTESTRDGIIGARVRNKALRQHRYPPLRRTQRRGTRQASLALAVFVEVGHVFPEQRQQPDSVSREPEAVVGQRKLASLAFYLVRQAECLQAVADSVAFFAGVQIRLRLLFERHGDLHRKFLRTLCEGIWMDLHNVAGIRSWSPVAVLVHDLVEHLEHCDVALVQLLDGLHERRHVLNLCLASQRVADQPHVAVSLLVVEFLCVPSHRQLNRFRNILWSRLRGL